MPCELKGKLKEKIEKNKELGILSKKLATIITQMNFVELVINGSISS